MLNLAKSGERHLAEMEHPFLKYSTFARPKNGARKISVGKKTWHQLFVPFKAVRLGLIELSLVESYSHKGQLVLCT